MAGLPGDDVPDVDLDSTSLSPSSSTSESFSMKNTVVGSGASSGQSYSDATVAGGGGGGASGASFALPIVGSDCGGNGSKRIADVTHKNSRPAGSIPRSFFATGTGVNVPLKMQPGGEPDTRLALHGGDSISAPRPVPGVLKRKRGDSGQGLTGADGLVQDVIIFGGTGNGALGAQKATKALALPGGGRVGRYPSSGGVVLGGGSEGDDGSNTTSESDHSCGAVGNNFFRVKLSETLFVNIPTVPPSLGNFTPDEFLTRIMSERGYDSRRSPALEVEHYRKRPSDKMVTDYDMHFVQAVRNRDIAKITQMHAEGRDMNACNKVGILHTAKFSNYDRSTI